MTYRENLLSLSRNAAAIAARADDATGFAPGEGPDVAYIIADLARLLAEALEAQAEEQA